MALFHLTNILQTSLSWMATTRKQKNTDRRSGKAYMISDVENMDVMIDRDHYGDDLSLVIFLGDQ